MELDPSLKSQVFEHKIYDALPKDQGLTFDYHLDRQPPAGKGGKGKSSWVAKIFLVRGGGLSVMIAAHAHVTPEYAMRVAIEDAQSVVVGEDAQSVVVGMVEVLNRTKKQVGG